MIDRLLFWSLLLAAFLIAGPAAAGPPAASPDADHDRAMVAFDRFADGWMKKLRQAERRSRERPEVRKASSGTRSTFRGYGDDVQIELRPTGHPSAPFVGLLRYQEHLYSCAAKAASSCSISRTQPVTEIFRFQNGRWVY